MAENKLPTIDIKGKQYVLVKDRVIAFNEKYPQGSIKTKLVAYKAGTVIIRATVIPDVSKPERKFVDYAQETIGEGNINKASALENCSTSAVGRALAYMGIGVVDSIASADEMNKAGAVAGKATPKQVVALRNMVVGFSNGNITKESADKAIMEIAKIDNLNELSFDVASGIMDEISTTKKVPLDFDDKDPELTPND